MPSTDARKFKSQETDIYSVEVAEPKEATEAWMVEVTHSDGRIEQAIFTGSRARERAEAYARREYSLN
jgi:hypothetical protein